MSEHWSLVVVIAVSLAAISPTAVAAGAPAASTGSARSAGVGAAPAGDWTMYGHDPARTQANPSPGALTPATAGALHLAWATRLGSPIAAQPIVSGGAVYVGTFDGYEHALDLSGTQLWTRDLGRTSGCNHQPTMGIADTAAVDRIGGSPAVFVGGGDGHLYALDAATGTVIWRTDLRSAPGAFLFASPVVWNGSIYTAVSDLNDCRQVPGEVVKVDEATGAVQRIFSTTPPGCIGVGVWSSPVIDTTTGLLYDATSEADPVGACPIAADEPLATSVIELNTTDLSLVASWAVPAGQRIVNGDFGGTGALFSATIGGVSRGLFGLANKDGLFAAFDRSAVAAGPVWSTRIANGGASPELGQGSIVAPSWDGSQLYVGGGALQVGTHGHPAKCAGTVQALDPATGTVAWRDCLPSFVLGAITSVPGLVLVGEGGHQLVLSAADGHVLSSYAEAGGAPFWGPAAVAGDLVLEGSMDGTLVAESTTAGLAVHPAQATAGGQVAFSGYGFAAGETVDLSFTDAATSATSVGSIVAGGTGLVSGAVVINATVAAGVGRLSATGATSGASAGVALTVAGSTLVAAPATVPTGFQTVLTGSGFTAGERVDLRFTDAVGTATGLPAATAAPDGTFSRSVTIPAGAAVGAGLLAAGGATSGAQSSAGVTVTAPHAVAYTTDAAGAGLVGVDPGTGATGPPIPTGAGPGALAITPDGAAAYVADSADGTVTPVNLTTGAAGPPIVVGQSPVAVAIAPNGRTVWVANRDSGTVSVIATATNTVTATVGTGGPPVAVALSPSGATAYAAVGGGLVPISPVTLTAGAPLAAGIGPLTAVAIAPGGTSAWVAGAGQAAQVSLPSGSVKATVNVGAGADGIAIAPDGTTVLVANGGDGTVTPISVGRSVSAGAALVVGGRPLGVAISPDARTAIVDELGASAAVVRLGARSLNQVVVGGGAVTTGVAFVPDQGPVASLSATAGAHGSPSTLDASASHDPDGTIDTYRWTFGDGSSALTVSPVVGHVYAAPGTYQVRVVVTDDLGISTSSVFTGQTMSQRGSSAATRQVNLVVP